MKRGFLLLFAVMVCATTVGCCCCADPRPFWHRPFWGKYWSCGSCPCGTSCGDDIDACSLGCSSCGSCQQCGYYDQGDSGYGANCPTNCVGCGTRPYYGDWWAGRARPWDPCDWCGNYTGPVRPPRRRAMRRDAMMGTPVESYVNEGEVIGDYSDYEVIPEGPATHSHPTPAPKKVPAPTSTPKSSAGKPSTSVRKISHNQMVRRTPPEVTTSRGDSIR